MAKTAVKAGAEFGIDEELLAEAMRAIGTSSPGEALNTVLKQYVENKRARRRQALENLQRMSDEGVFNYAALDELDR